MALLDTLKMLYTPERLMEAMRITPNCLHVPGKGTVHIGCAEAGGEGPPCALAAVAPVSVGGRLEEIASLYEAGIIEKVTAMELLNTPLQPEPMPCVKDDRHRPPEFECPCVGCTAERSASAPMQGPVLEDKYQARMLDYGWLLRSAPGPLPGPEPHDDDDEDEDEDEDDDSELPTKTHCTCGAELMGAKAKRLLACGDCITQEHARKPDLDTRIKAAAMPDADPTSDWSAGDLPNWSWP